MAAESLAVDLPFIGRVDELALLRRALDGVLAGTPRLVLLSGDAGVGKSRLVSELSAVARAARMTVLSGTCHEDVAIPYLPIATAFRRLDHPGVQSLAPSRRSPTSTFDVGGTDDHRLQVFMDATAALMDTAEANATLLAIEDVHWADEASAELIRHLALAAMHEATAVGLPVMMILTARQSWPDGVPKALARLPREEAALELHLHRFGVVETHTMVAALSGGRPRSEVTSAILEATGGNPLLMRGVISRNLSSGRLAVSGDSVELAGDRTLMAPTDLDDEVRIRLSKVEAPCQAMLTTAAVLGDGEELVALGAAFYLGIEPLVGEAVEAGLLVVDGPRFRFAHPQMRQVLYHDLDDRERTALHLQIADALEKVSAGRERALAVAHHLQRGGADPHDERVAQWALRAGEQAWATGAWEDALTAYGLALGGAARRMLAAEELTEILLRSGISAYYANDDSCAAWLREAATLAQERGDVTRWAEALVLAARFRFVGTAATVGAPAPVAELERALAAVDDNPSLRARLLATLADLHFVELDHERAADYARQASAALDSRVGDAAGARVSFVLGLQQMAAIDLAGARRHFAAAMETGDEHLVLAAEARVGLTHLAEGSVEDAAAALTRARVGERRLSSHAGQQMPSAALAALHVLRGEFGDADRLAAEVVALYRIQEYAFTPGMVFPTLAASRIGRGDADGAQDALDQWRACGGRGAWRYEALIRCLAGDSGSVADDLAARRWPAPGEVTLFTADTPCLYVAVGAAVRDVDLVSSALPALERAHSQGLVFTLGWPWLLSRVVGDGYTALGQLAAAERWYRRASVEAARGAATTEQALVHLGEARVALARGDGPRAAELATESATAFDAVDALLLAETARQLADQAGGEVSPPPPRDRFIMFTDIVGSTELNVRAGDDRYLGLLEEHDRTLRARLRRHDGVEYKHTGDGMSAWFASAEAAVSCALGMQADLEQAALAHADLPVHVRMGISAGQPVDTSDGLFGLAVVRSARICALAEAGQVLVTDDVRRLTDRVCTYAEIGERLLKGFPEPDLVHEAIALR